MKKIMYVLILLASFHSCQQSKLSPEELISKIENNGHTVKIDGIIASFAQNSEVQFWLRIDSDKISAYRFDSPETAKTKAEGFSSGYSNGYWAFDYVTDESKQLLEEALK